MQNLRNSVEVWTYSALWIWLWAHYSITENLDIQGSAIKNNVLPMSEWTEGLWWATAGNGSDTSLGQCHLKLMRPTVASFFFWSSCNSSLSLDHLNDPFKLSSFENSWVLLFFHYINKIVYVSQFQQFLHDHICIQSLKTATDAFYLSFNYLFACLIL